jgi:hypothetical protein
MNSSAIELPRQDHLTVNWRFATPLLRGILVGLSDWFDDPKNPDLQFQEAVLEVWCCYCKRVHAHLWSLESDYSIASHRVAHCWRDTPFSENGYFVAPFFKKSREGKCHVVQPGRPITRPKPAKLILPTLSPIGGERAA